MKITRLIWCALCATVFAALCLVGCQEMDIYEVDAPADLQHKIDSIAAVKAGMNTGDTTYITITTPIVGAEDNSSAWWTVFSDYFKVPTNKLLHLEFINHGTGVNNWNNWNLAVANVPDRDAENYAEYFVLRSDAFGWGNGDFDGGLIAHDYPDTNGNDDIWDDFRTTMQGAYVSIDIDHSATGNVYVTAKAVGTNGTTITETYQQPVSATEDIVAFLVCDGSYFQMKKAYLLPSRVVAIDDVNAASITISNAPASVELGNDNFWGNATATVTFADGSSEEVDSADISFNVIPDMTTLGVKTVVAAYSKTKQGKFGPPVSTLYTLEVTSAVVSIAANNINYYYFSSDAITFRPKGIVVTATYANGSTAILEDNVLDFDYPNTIPATPGTQTVDITYVGTSNTFTTTSTVTLVKGTAQVGKSDFSTAWWTAFSSDYSVPSGSSKVITLYCYSNNLANWNSPSTILRKADMSEYAVVRMDNFGWGPGYAAATPTSNWNWDTFTSNISGSKIVITVTNNGNNTADILYNVTYATGETHFQKYAGITVDSSNLNAALVTEGAYLVIIN